MQCGFAHVCVVAVSSVHVGCAGWSGGGGGGGGAGGGGGGGGGGVRGASSRVSASSLRTNRGIIDDI